MVNNGCKSHLLWFNLQFVAWHARSLEVFLVLRSPWVSYLHSHSWMKCTFLWHHLAHSYHFFDFVCRLGIYMFYMVIYSKIFALVMLCSWKFQCLVDRLLICPHGPDRLTGWREDWTTAGGRCMPRSAWPSGWAVMKWPKNWQISAILPKKSWDSAIRKWRFPVVGVPKNEWFIMGNPIKMEDFGGKKWQAQIRFEGLGKLNIWPIAKAGAPSNYGSQGRQGKGSGSCDGVVSE